MKERALSTVETRIFFGYSNISVLVDRLESLGRDIKVQQPIYIKLLFTSQDIYGLELSEYHFQIYLGFNYINSSQLLLVPCCTKHTKGCVVKILHKYRQINLYRILLLPFYFFYFKKKKKTMQVIIKFSQSRCINWIYLIEYCISLYVKVTPKFKFLSEGINQNMTHTLYS